MITQLHTNQNIKITVTQMHTHFMQLYIAGKIPCLTDVTKISEREWVPTHLTIHKVSSATNYLDTLK